MSTQIPQTTVDDVLNKITEYEQLGGSRSSKSFQHYALKRDIESAIKNLKKSSPSEGYMMDMIFHGILGDEEKCRSHYLIAKQQGGKNQNIEWNFILSLDYLGFHQEASRLVLDLLKHEKGNVELYQGAATHFVDQGFFDKAREVLKMAAKLNDQFIDNRLQIVEKLADFVRDQQISISELNRYMETIVEFQKEKGLFFKERGYNLLSDGYEKTAYIEILTGLSVDETTKLNDDLFSTLAEKDFSDEVALNFVTMFR